MIRDYEWNYRFMNSLHNYDDASVIMVGIPFDYTVSFRSGARFGPQKIREVSYGLEEYSPYIDRDLKDSSFYDLGDIELPFGDIESSFKMISNAASDIYKDNKKTLFIGGEHSISFPIIKSAVDKYKDIAVLHFDAHADLREDYLGVKESHASVMRRVSEIVNPKNIYQFGIRSGTEDEFKFAKANTHFYPFDVYEPLQSILHEIKDRYIYITFDIDVLDPAFACGTGTPEPGGCTSREILDSIKLLKDFNVIGFDLVEVSPPYDTSDRTPILAAKIIREGLLSFFYK